jgi:NNP family nitrate/nitrite transporter-like MFS transporter
MVSTLSFTVCFMVWMMFGVIGIPIKKALALNASEFGLLTAMPVLTGSLVRVPLGIWTDRYGGRIVMTVLMALTVKQFDQDETQYPLLHFWYLPQRDDRM